MQDYYGILGLSRNASDKDIRQAFHKLARKYHPDLNGGDKRSENKFKQINEANEVLSDPATRSAYDKYGNNWRSADRIEAQQRQYGKNPYKWSPNQGSHDINSGLFGGFDDLFNNISHNTTGRGKSRNRDMQTDVGISLEEAFSGTTRIVTISNGGKQRRLEVSIPAGVNDGSMVLVKPGKGQELKLNITINSHKRFKRTGDDLIVELEVPLVQAILGGEIEVETLSGKIRLKVPPESSNGQRLRLEGRGMPKDTSSTIHGDMFVILRPSLPKNLSDEEIELFRKLKELGT